MNQPSVHILSCGDELLFGHTIDTNAAWLAEECVALGWRVTGHRTVGDVTQDIVEAVTDASSRADVVILTGGLGPTEDDRTRHALALALDSELEERPELVEEVRRVFERFRRPMSDVNRVQARIPKAASPIHNPNGTAPGIQAVLGRARIFSLPGVPREMREMFNLTIRPFMEAIPTGGREVLRRLHLFGLGESDIGHAIRDVMGEKSNPEVGTTVAEGVITVRIYARGRDAREASGLADKTEAAIRSRLGGHIYGSDGESMASVVTRLLKERNALVSVAESCTGGMIASMLVDVPGISDALLEGIVAYANIAKSGRLGVPKELIDRHGAVSREVALAMADGVWPGRSHPDRPCYSLATTGIAGPDGGTPEKPVGTVWIACAAPGGDGAPRLVSYCLHSVSDRYGTRLRASHAALDLLRRLLLGIPNPRLDREDGRGGVDAK